MATVVEALPDFDFAAFVAAFNSRRRSLELTWFDFASDLWDQSAQLNGEREDHPLCGGALYRLENRGETSCQYALFMLRWLGRAPEDFLVGPVVEVGDTRLPSAGPDRRLRWNLNELYEALNQQRRDRGLTWAALATTLAVTPSRLTNLKTAKQADLALTMRITQWLGAPAARFIHPATW